MTIFRANRERNGGAIYKWLLDAHRQITQQENFLRNAAEVFADAVDEWRTDWAERFSNLTAFNDAHGSGGSGWFAEQYGAAAQAALDGALSSLQAIGGVVNNVLVVNYTSDEGFIERRLVSTADRNAIADAIGAELEA